MIQSQVVPIRFGCFIRSNTESLQNKLKDLCVPHNSFDGMDRPWIAYNFGMWISVGPGFDQSYETDFDCGENEELFLALVANECPNCTTDFGKWFKVPKIKTVQVSGYCGQTGLGGYQRIQIGWDYFCYDRHDFRISETIRFNEESGEDFNASRMTNEEIIKVIRDKEDLPIPESTSEIKYYKKETRL